MDGGQGWDTYLMYEPMFGTNAADNTLMTWLGQSITWTNSTTITIVLRNGIKWTDGSPIITQDVQYTFKLLQQLNQTVSLIDRIGPISNSSMEIVDLRTIKVHINPGYANSSEVYRQLVYGRLIVPKKVWAQINASVPSLSSFTNDWNSAGFNSAWKVASGMYLPMWHDTVSTVMQRNDNWWGVRVFGRGPAPKYFGYTGMLMVATIVLEQEYLDWSGYYVPGLDTIMAAYPFLHTYFSTPPYMADGSAVLLIPNNMVYPLNCSWLHKAISCVLDYDAMNALSSGYLKKPSPLLIPADDAVARELLNTTIEAKYAITYNATKGREILNQHCVKDVNGTWWTKDLGPDGRHYPLGKFDKINNRSAGAWTIIDIDGWTDVNLMDQYAAASISSLLDIPVTTLFLSWGDYTGSKYFGNATSPPTFDFADYCMELSFNANLYERYTQLFTGPQGVWNHYGNYTNATLTTLLGQLDMAPKGSAAQWRIANRIQEIVGQEMPIIPLAGRPNWYVYSSKYWHGWTNSGHNAILPAGPFGTGAQEAQLHAIVFGLEPNTPPAAITDLATSNPTNTSIRLTWTAPGDDGMNGNCTGYVVKYSSSGRITDSSWDSATTYAQSRTPVKNGTTETHVITGLTNGTTCWFAIKAYDQDLNYGGVSNSPSGTTLTPGWSTNAPIVLIPGTGNNVTTPVQFFRDYNFSVTINSATDVVVTSSDVAPPDVGSLPSGAGSFIFLKVEGQFIAGATVVTVYVFYNRTSVQQLGINETTMRLYRWNSTTALWDTVPGMDPVINSTHGVVIGYLTHFSYFAVFGALFTHGGEGDGTFVILILVAATAVVVVVASIVFVKRRSSRKGLA
jgi:ABC-type transport system substrate-binding protein